MRGIRRRARGPLVGRADELNRCEQLLRGQLDAIYVYGEHGLGKSRLLEESATRAERLGMPVCRLDAQRLRPSPENLERLLLELPESSPDAPALLIIDGFEAHACLEVYYRDKLLPALAAGTRLLFAGLNPLTLPWQAQSRRKVLHFPLKRLSQIESEDYLSAAGVPEECRTTVGQRARGMPLLLASMAEFVLDGQCDHIPGTGNRCSVADLLQHVVREAPSNEHRQALWAAAMPEVLSERLLAAILDQPRSNECYRWLSGRPYIERVQGGLVVHPLFREPLLRDLRDTEPGTHREFLLRCGRFHIARIEGLRDPRRRVACAYTHFYAQRSQPPVSALFEQLSASCLYRDSAMPADQGPLQCMVERHEGAKAGEIFRHWFHKQPDRTIVFRNIRREPQAVVQTISLSELGKDDQQLDPAVAAAFNLLRVRAEGERAKASKRPRRHRRLGHKAQLVRFWLDASQHQASSPGQAQTIAQMAFSTLAATDLSILMVVTTKRTAAQASDLLESRLLHRFEAGDFELDGQTYSMVGLDLDTTPCGRVLRNALTKMLAGDRRSALSRSGAWQMSRGDFAAAVQAALERFDDPQALSQNPLVESIPNAGQVPVEFRVRQWILDGVGRVARMPGGSAYANQLQRRYIYRDERKGQAPSPDSQQLNTAKRALVATLWDSLMQHQRVRQRAV